MFDSSPLKSPSCLRPLLFASDGKIILNMDQSPLRKSATENLFGMAPLSNAQTEALDMVLALARMYQKEIVTLPGDLIFVNNFSIMHSRRAFQDDERRQRHLVRLWLRNDELGWRIPDGLRYSWDVVFRCQRDSEDFLYPVEPKPEYNVPKISEGSGSALLIADQTEEEWT
jgi:hypothetical protein